MQVPFRYLRSSNTLHSQLFVVTTRPETDIHNLKIASSAPLDCFNLASNCRCFFDKCCARYNACFLNASRCAYRPRIRYNCLHNLPVSGHLNSQKLAFLRMVRRIISTTCVFSSPRYTNCKVISACISFAGTVEFSLRLKVAAFSRGTRSKWIIT